MRWIINKEHTMKMWGYVFALALLLSQSVLANARQAELQSQLPDNTGVYVRLPSFWDWFGAAKGNRPLDKAVASKPHRALIAELRQAIPGLAGLPDESRPAIEFLLSEHIAPLEIVVLSDAGVLSPISKVLMQTSVASRDSAAFSKRFTAMMGPAAASMPMQFDAQTGRLRLVAGMGASAADFDLFDQQPAKNSAPMHQALARIDESGQGFAVWIDIKALRPLIAMGSASGEASAEFANRISEQFDSLAFGLGAQQGFGQMALDLYPKANADWMNFVPQAPRRLDLASAGEADWVLSLALPSDADITRIEQSLARWDAEAKAAKTESETETETGEPMKPSLESFRAALETKFLEELTPLDLLKTFGPELLIFSDRSGDFSALRLRDKARYQKILALIKAHAASYKFINGIHRAHLALPMEDATGASTEEMQLLRKLTGSLVFWREEKDWIVFAGAPQMLRDRASLRPISIEQQLTKGAGSNGAAALLGAHGKVDKMAARTWNGYLGLLAQLAESTEAKADIDSLPSALELGLPAQSNASVTLEYQGNRLSLLARYENSPADILASQSGLGTVFTIAVVSAIAIPAYQDYVHRSQATQAMVEASAMKLALAEKFAVSDQLAKAGSIPAVDGENFQITWDGKNIVIRFSETHPHVNMRGRQLVLAPVRLANGQLGFRCGKSTQPAGKLLALDPSLQTTLADRVLPSACRP
jgi:hypothetical protein